MNATFASADVRLLGSGSQFPGAPISSEALVDILASHCQSGTARKARILASRLGIKSRHLSRNLDQGISQPTQDNPSLCVGALQQAMAQAGQAEQPSYLIGHTTTPHTLVPPNAAWVAERLNWTSPYMELRQACTGFANALQAASAMLAGGMPSLAVVGSELGSVYFDISDSFIDNAQLVNFVQMGDGAGAVVLGPANASQGALLSDIFIGHIGNGRQPGLALNQGGSGQVHCLHGLPAFEQNPEAIRESGPDLFEAGIAALSSRGYALNDFDWLLPHQANGKLAGFLADKLQFPEERIVVHADQLGNLGSAAIWVSLDRLRRSGKLQHGDRVLVLGAEATKYIYGGFVYHHNE